MPDCDAYQTSKARFGDEMRCFRANYRKLQPKHLNRVFYVMKIDPTTTVIH